ncbi:MAG TPA: hypothetical protein VD907_02995 [Verrucomicrobiae bacterium]|nr:hypothetical protein [Verrucomicrobiae bacterium]
MPIIRYVEVPRKGFEVSAGTFFIAGDIGPAISQLFGPELTFTYGGRSGSYSVFRISMRSNSFSLEALCDELENLLQAVADGNLKLYQQLAEGIEKKYKPTCSGPGDVSGYIEP